MYLYLGSETVINTKDIIGIFDLDNASTTRATKLYLTAAQRNGAVVNVTDDLPKSFVVCEKNSRPKVYLSQISPATLKKRMRYP
ncbi:MAG: DUF370 domain-containing protein [Oscillospiraceae bacterium]|nr:DUF370 domain-containing protein [Oscillospiraceae bacterium]